MQISKEQYENCLAERITMEAYEKLAAGRVAIAGLGGLGSHIAIMLARCGVGKLHLIDFDEVDLSNIHRQAYHLSQIGKKKTEAIAELICEINPYIKLHLDDIRVEKEQVATLFADEDIICEAFDHAEAKTMLLEQFLTNRTVWIEEKKLVTASGMAGFASANTIITRQVLKNVYQCGDGVSDIADDIGLTSARVTICAAHQANMILRLLLGEKTP
ncbi:MAG: sulfur carrier protein ThiS adenylyltransferase ThiF [Lachnospiraceae bacterium]|nr:sulfur carrier protein ThiS adenylyltransferase ThiF [Lachnospiraceae bacterium]